MDTARPPEPVSPSLAPDAANGRAYELKYLLPAEAAQNVEAWSRANLHPDPHGDSALGGAYEITSLYLDTPRFDVFHSSPELRETKYRLRRYGAGAMVFLERKRRRKDRVWKRRTTIPMKELALLDGAPPEWPGTWFRNEVDLFRFRPVCGLTYLRLAFFGDGGAYRVTIDRGIRGVPRTDWTVGRVDGEGTPVAEGLAVVELKFREALPSSLKPLVATLAVGACGASKYRSACRAARIDVGKAGPDA